MPISESSATLLNTDGTVPALTVRNTPGTAKGIPALAVDQEDSTGPALQVTGQGDLINLKNAAGVSQFKVDNAGNVAAGGSFPQMGGYSHLGSAVGWTMPPVYAQSSVLLPTAGVMFLNLIDIPTAATTSNFNMFVTTAGNTLANVFAALLNTSGAFVASTANRAADAALTSSGALWTAPWQTPFAATPGQYYGVILIGSFTTAPTFVSGRSSLNTLTNIGTSVGAVNLRSATSGSSLSALPGSVTMSGVASNQNPFWMCIT